jgi:hypothetical protein
MPVHNNVGPERVDTFDLYVIKCPYSACIGSVTAAARFRGSSLSNAICCEIVSRMKLSELSMFALAAPLQDEIVP